MLQEGNAQSAAYSLQSLVSKAQQQIILQAAGLATQSKTATQKDPEVRQQGLETVFACVDPFPSCVHSSKPCHKHMAHLKGKWSCLAAMPRCLIDGRPKSDCHKESFR